MRRKATRRQQLEVLAGFVAFFAVVAVVSAAVEVVRSPTPGVVPALVAAGLLLLLWLVVRKWRNTP